MDADYRLTPSMLDRLMDPESGGTRNRQGYSVEQMVAVVRRDIENLLNTRVSILQLPDEFPEVKNSLLGYGLPDFGSIATSTRQQHEAIGRRIEDVIAKFEPRLTDVHVLLIEEPNKIGQLTLRFAIESRLSAEPFPDVSFETVLELTTGYTSIQATKS